MTEATATQANPAELARHYADMRLSERALAENAEQAELVRELRKRAPLAGKILAYEFWLGCLIHPNPAPDFVDSMAISLDSPVPPDWRARDGYPVVCRRRTDRRGDPEFGGIEPYAFWMVDADTLAILKETK